MKSQMIMLVTLIFMPHVGEATRVVIETDKDPGARCTNPVIAPETCEMIRQEALQKGCIDQVQYEALKRLGSYPLCLYVGQSDEYLRSWCPCGCFHSDVNISVYWKESTQPTQVRAEEVMKDFKDYRLIHLNEKESKIGHFKHQATPIRISTHGPETLPLVEIITQDGRKLLVTDRHPILTARGEMVMASELKKEDGLLNFQGKRVELESLSRVMSPENKEVVNFMVDAELSQKAEHVIFAENLAVGDLAWQSSLEDEYQQVFLRQ